jgi:hypothetical protein
MCTDVQKLWLYFLVRVYIRVCIRIRIRICICICFCICVYALEGSAARRFRRSAMGSTKGVIVTVAVVRLAVAIVVACAPLLALAPLGAAAMVPAIAIGTAIAATCTCTWCACACACISACACACACNQYLLCAIAMMHIEIEDGDTVEPPGGRVQRADSLRHTAQYGTPQHTQHATIEASQSATITAQPQVAATAIPNSTNIKCHSQQQLASLGAVSAPKLAPPTAPSLSSYVRQHHYHVTGSTTIICIVGSKSPTTLLNTQNPLLVASSVFPFTPRKGRKSTGCMNAVVCAQQYHGFVVASPQLTRTPVAHSYVLVPA